MKNKTNGMIFLVLGSLLVLAFAQDMPPRQEAKLDLSGTQVRIDYGSPSLKDRSLEDLLAQLPADRIWRAGDNQVTTFEAGRDVLIGETRVAAGKYSLYVHCAESGDFSLVLNRVIGQPLKSIYAQAPPHLADAPWPHFNYQQEIGEHEAARVPMRRTSLQAPQDRFRFDFREAVDGAELVMSWGDSSWAVPVRPAP